MSREPPFGVEPKGHGGCLSAAFKLPGHQGDAPRVTGGSMSHDKDNDPVEEVDLGYHSDEDGDDLDDEPVTPIELACV